MPLEAQKLSVVEKIGYSLGDAAANFVFMTMILFQANFYTDVMGHCSRHGGHHHPAAASVGRLLRSVDGRARRPHAHRAGADFGPWILFTAVPWGIVMVLAYTTPSAGARSAIVAYALDHQHAADDALLGEQHALRGAGRRDDRRRPGARQLEFVPLRGGECRAIHRSAVSRCRWWRNLPGIYGDGRYSPRDRLANHDGNLGRLCVVFFLITFATTRERIEPAVDAQIVAEAGFRRSVGQ